MCVGTYTFPLGIEFASALPTVGSTMIEMRTRATELKTALLSASNDTRFEAASRALSGGCSETLPSR
jgi:hypothetical protein